MKDRNGNEIEVGQSASITGVVASIDETNNAITLDVPAPQSIGGGKRSFVLTGVCVDVLLDTAAPPKAPATT